MEYFIGAVLGACFGAMAMAVFASGGRADDRSEIARHIRDKERLAEENKKLHAELAKREIRGVRKRRRKEGAVIGANA